MADIIRTERGLTISGTRITLYDVMDYVTAQYPPKFIRALFNLTDEQINAALSYIKSNRLEFEAEYRTVLSQSQENQKYWKEIEGRFWRDKRQWGFDSQRHMNQLFVLIQSLEWHWQDRKDFFISGNIPINYCSIQNLRNPDFFVVLGTERNKERRTWITWQEEGKYPNVIVEFLSDETRFHDKTEKKQLYQEVFRTPEYYWYDPFTQEFVGFDLISGSYEHMTFNDRGWSWSQQLGLYLGIYQEQLRYFSPDGDLVLTPQEEMRSTP